MANGYGGSTSSSGSTQRTTTSSGSTQSTTTSSSSTQRTTSVMGQIAPPGFHYMPDGTLMSDAEHAILYGSKTITSFDLDLSDLPASSTRRNFTVSGDSGGVFSLEIRNEDGHYYNFVTQLFQVAKARLKNKTIEKRVYRGSITFPAITDNDHYDIYLWAEPGTTHIDSVEARFEDGSLDLNSSIGSNSLLMQKIIYQYTDVTLTLSTLSPLSTIETGSQANATITIPRGGSKIKTAFSLSCSVSSAPKCYKIIKQPSVNDMFAYITMGVDSSVGTVLPGENIYPTVTGTDTVNGDVSSGVAVTMNSAVSSKMAIGDRVTGNSDLNARTVTVVSLDSTNVFSMSEAIAVGDGITLSFSNHVQYSWLMDNIVGIKEGMTANISSTNVTANSIISNYQKTLTLHEGTENETTLITHEAPFVHTTGTPGYTNGVLTVQAGEIVFDKQQKLVLVGDTLNIGGYGKNKIVDTINYIVEVTDLNISLSTTTATTTSAVNNSTTVPISSVNGIVPSTTTVSGIGIDPSVSDPSVVSRSVTSGAGNIVLSAAQTLESGTTLTFSDVGQTATITGNIKVTSPGINNASIYFDVEKLLSIT